MDIIDSELGTMRIHFLDEGKKEINRQLEDIGSMSYEEKIVLTVFILTGLAWITRTFFLNKFLPNLDDSIIALISGISLFIFQANSKSGKKEKAPCVTLILLSPYDGVVVGA